MCIVMRADTASNSQPAASPRRWAQGPKHLKYQIIKLTEDQIINQIEHSLRNYALRDIKLISNQDTVIASFILCSCFIEHICTFRYGMSKLLSDKEFTDFVVEYLNHNYPEKYDAKKLRSDLRNKLVHNYSLGETYALVMGQHHLHLQKLNETVIFLNLENFIIDLERAFNLYIEELRSDKDNLRELALTAFEKVKIIGLLN